MKVGKKSSKPLKSQIKGTFILRRNRRFYKVTKTRRARGRPKHSSGECVNWAMKNKQITSHKLLKPHTHLSLCCCCVTVTYI